MKIEKHLIKYIEDFPTRTNTDAYNFFKNMISQRIVPIITKFDNITFLNSSEDLSSANNPKCRFCFNVSGFEDLFFIQFNTSSYNGGSILWGMCDVIDKENLNNNRCTTSQNVGSSVSNTAPYRYSFEREFIYIARVGNVLKSLGIDSSAAKLIINWSAFTTATTGEKIYFNSGTTKPTSFTVRKDGSNDIYTAFGEPPYCGIEQKAFIMPLFFKKANAVDSVLIVDEYVTLTGYGLVTNTSNTVDVLMKIYADGKTYRQLQCALWVEEDE